MIQTREIQAAARSMGQKLLVLNAGTISELDQAFETLVKRGANALVMSADLFFQVRREQLVALAIRHRIPTMYEWREFVEAGGLISYSTVRAETSRQHGNYVGRVLNGAKPATYQSSGRPSLNSSSIAKPRKLSASPFRITAR
jgi:putative ABC transport system substrate-binding protein